MLYIVKQTPAAGKPQNKHQHQRGHQMQNPPRGDTPSSRVHQCVCQVRFSISDTRNRLKGHIGRASLPSVSRETSSTSDHPKLCGVIADRRTAINLTTYGK